MSERRETQAGPPAGQFDGAHRKRRGHGRGAFTLVEALLAVATLGIMAAGIATLYASGLNAIEFQSGQIVVQSQLRSEMEQVVAAPFHALTNQVRTVSLAGRTFTSRWDAVTVDLDGDSVAEPDAKQVTVTIDGMALVVLQVDDDDKVGKL